MGMTPSKQHQHHHHHNQEQHVTTTAKQHHKKKKRWSKWFGSHSARVRRPSKAGTSKLNDKPNGSQVAASPLSSANPASLPQIISVSPVAMSAMSDPTGVGDTKSPRVMNVAPLLPPMSLDSNDSTEEHDDSVRQLFPLANQTKPQPRTKENILTRSKAFQKLSKWAFNVVDTDDSGAVDKKELYSGLLLIHLNLASYAGPAACKPMSRDAVYEVFDKMDLDSSGTLDYDEFLHVMMILCSQIVSRVIIQWTLTLLIVPVVAQYVFAYVKMGWAYVTDFLLWEYCFILYRAVCQAIVNHTPILVKKFVWKVQIVLDYIDDSILDSLPITLLSCILGCIVVPWTIFKIDEYFEKVTDKKTREIRK